MGTSSMNCALTGLEIQEGDIAYAFSINEIPDQYDGHKILMPPVKGEYTGYSSIVLLESFPILDLEEGDDWKPDDDNSAFIHADVFAALDGLQHEQSCATLGEELESEILDMKSRPLRDVLKSQTMAHFWLNSTGLIMEISGFPSDLVEGLNATVKNDDFFELYRRCRLVKRAEVELRHPITAIRRGPQDGGDRALIHMNKVVSDIMQGRIEDPDVEIGL